MSRAVPAWIGFSAALCLAWASSLAWARPWTDRNGQTIEANFLRMNGADVILLRANKTVPVPFANLSAADQDYLRNHLLDKGLPEQIPPLAAQPRAWRDRGNQSLLGTLVYARGGKVWLRDAGGKVTEIGFDQLGDADQDFLRKEMETFNLPNNVPKAVATGNNPADPFVAEPFRDWYLANFTTMRGKMTRVEANQIVLLDGAGGQQTLEYTRMSDISRKYVTDFLTKNSMAIPPALQAASNPQPATPTDPMATGQPAALKPGEREWVDWRGGKFVAKLTGTEPPRVVLEAGGRETRRHLFSLSEADRQFVRAQRVSGGQADTFPPDFVEPATEYRDWLFANGAQRVGGKYVTTLDGVAVFVVVRVEDRPDHQLLYTAISPDDQRYVRQQLQNAGQTALLAKIPDPGPATTPSTTTPGTTTSTTTGTTTGTGTPGADEYRAWTTFDGQRLSDAKFVEYANEKVLLERRPQPPLVLVERREVFYNQLSLADQDYVRNLLRARGQEHLLPPDPRAQTAAMPTTGPVVTSLPEPEAPKKSWWERQYKGEWMIALVGFTLYAFIGLGVVRFLQNTL